MSYDPKNPHYDPYTAPPVFGDQPVTGPGYPDGGYPDAPPPGYPDQGYAQQMPPQAPAYHPSGYMPPPQPPVYRAPENGTGVAALILGIIGVIGCTLCAVPAVICGHMGMKKADRGEADNRGVAQAGLILGYIGIGFMVLAIIYLIVMFVIIGAAASSSTYDSDYSTYFLSFLG